MFLLKIISHANLENMFKIVIPGKWPYSVGYWYILRPGLPESRPEFQLKNMYIYNLFVMSSHGRCYSKLFANYIGHMIQINISFLYDVVLNWCNWKILREWLTFQKYYT